MVLIKSDCGCQFEVTYNLSTSYFHDTYGGFGCTSWVRNICDKHDILLKDGLKNILKERHDKDLEILNKKVKVTERGFKPI